MNVTKLVVHHSASPRMTTTKDDLTRWHLERGFTEIGYHKVIEAEGKIVEGRVETKQGAHAQGANAGSLGVCVVGNYETELPVPAQIDALVDVLAAWCTTHGLDSSKIYGHFDVPSGTTVTVCPGKNMRNQLTTIRSKVQARL